MATSTISNTIKDPSGVAVPSVVVEATLVPDYGFRISDSSEIAARVTTTANGSGFWSLALERTANITPANSIWVIEEQIPVASGGRRVWAISVGASNASLLASQINPIPSVGAPLYLTQAAADARYLPLGAGASNLHIVSLSDYALDDGTDVATAFQNAVNATPAGGILWCPFDLTGVYGLASMVTLSKDIEIWCAGFRAVVFNWLGGASPMFDVTNQSRVRWVGPTFRNSGTGTASVRDAVGAERPSFEWCSWTGGNAWSEAAVVWGGNGFGYAFINRCEVEVSPFLKITGNAGTNLFVDNTIFDATVGVVPFLLLDVAMNYAYFGPGVTVNSNTTSRVGTFIDNSASARNIDNLVFLGSLDGNALSASPPPPSVFKLANIGHFQWGPGNVHQYGQIADAVAVITNSRAHVEGITGQSINDYLIRATDPGTSLISAGHCKLEVTNTKGIISTTAGNSADLIGVTIGAEYAAVANIHLERGDPGGNTVYYVPVPTNAAFTVGVAALTDAHDKGYPTLGQKFTVMIANNSGGAMGVITWGAGFSLNTATAWANPANGKRASITFVFDGTNYLELWRSV